MSYVPDSMFRQITQNNWIAIVFSDTKGIITYVNDAANKLYGYDEGELLGKPSAVLAVDDVNIPKVLQEILEKGGWSGEMPQKKKDGTAFTALLTVWLTYDENNAPTGMSSNCMDISERKIMEVEIQKLNTELEYKIQERTSQLQTSNVELAKAKATAEQALDIQKQFLANTSHEIRTPMNGILGMIRQLFETPLNAEQEEYLQVIREASNNLLHVVNDVLDISKIQAGKLIFEKTEFRLNDLLKNVLFTLKYKAEEKNLYLNKISDEDVPLVLIGDPFRLNQILLNLIGNAIKFTESGGVTVSANMVKLNDKRVVIEFRVYDTGIGIPDDKIDFVFETFAQVETHNTRKYEGTGLGLSITKSLVEEQGGSISVNSKIGEGTTFSFSLPFEIGDPSWQGKLFQSMEGIPDSADLSDINVLLVEDNLINQRVAFYELNKWKAKTDIANDAQIAIEKLNQKQYDIILMDISMPGMDGFEATQYIRNNFKTPIKNIPIIAMTASAMQGEKENCLRAGMNDYISKPFNPATLYSKIVKWGKKQDIVTPELQEPYSLKKDKLIDLGILREYAAGDVSYIKEIIDMYIHSMPEYLQELNTQASKANWSEVQKQAHKMKTPAAYFGVLNLKNTLIDIESETESTKDNEHITDLVKKAENELKISIKELKAELEKIV